MNRIRILVNIVLGVAAALGGVALLFTDQWTWYGSGSPTVFTGTSLQLLGVGCLFLAGFAGSIAYGWITGEVEMPPAGEVEPHPAYRGHLMARYWYLFLPSIACLVGALWLAH